MVLGFLKKIMEAGHGDDTEKAASGDINKWAAGRNEILRRLHYEEAVTGKGSHFQQNVTVPKTKQTVLSSQNADSLVERIVFDCVNMLKLSESGRKTVENGQLKLTCVPNFYFDTTGNLTVGYGTNLQAHPDMLAALEVVDNKTGRVLSLAEKQQYVRRLQAQYAAMGSPRNMSDAKYAQYPVFNECHVTEVSATTAMQREIQSHLNELLADFRRAGVNPETIDHNILKLALDIKYNVGGQLSKKYPTLFKKICAGDYAAIEPKDYRARTSKTNPNACNVAREKMKGALVQQAQLLQKAMRECPRPANATAAELTAYKQRVFEMVVNGTFSIYRSVPNGQILLPDGLRSMALSIDTALLGPLNVRQMQEAVQVADNRLASAGFRVADAGAGSNVPGTNQSQHA